MTSLDQQIVALKKQYETALAQASTMSALEDLRITFLGREGAIAKLMDVLKGLNPEEKRVYGPQLNSLKASATTSYEEKKKGLELAQVTSAIEQQRFFDVTASTTPPLPQGSKHLYTQIIERLEDIFMSMGYQVVHGPEVETDYYNFEALNIPASHPAREMHDTFWLNKPGYLLRTHTSTVEIRAMEAQKPPIAIVSLGRCYRNEATDASHDFMFTQAEGLFIDKNVSLAQLIGTVKSFLAQVFERTDINIRVRPGYFPFVEPGIEFDVQCPFCTTGCSTCKHTTWIEIMGAGLTHPNVLKYGGIDSTTYAGFAFGMGIERLAMIKYGISDIRLFHSNKIGFLEQF